MAAAAPKHASGALNALSITTLAPAATAPEFERWLERGYAGEMHYLARGAEKRRDARAPYAGTVSAVVVALDYGGHYSTGPIARYARGDAAPADEEPLARRHAAWAIGRLRSRLAAE